MMDSVEACIGLLKKETDPWQKIISSSAYWLPLAWLYSEMIRNKDLIPLIDLDTRSKVKYWSVARKVQRSPFAKKLICQALYCWEYLSGTGQV